MPSRLHHSFAIYGSAKKLLRVRLVQDDGRDIGSRVTDDVLSIDSDTLFPLQGALGYDMVQHLFIAPHNLVVEGTSDLLNLSLISYYLREKNRIARPQMVNRSRWRSGPCANFCCSSRKAPSRYSPGRLSQRKGHQRLQQLKQHGILKDTSLVTIGSVLNSKLADIEDLFSEQDISCWSMRHSATTFVPTQLLGSDPSLKERPRLRRGSI